MKKYICYILLFFSIFACIDYIFGLYCRSLQKAAIYGNNHDIYHIANNANEDIIIMGSSRCHHHFVPSVIKDSIGMTCFNAGCDGNGIIYQYGLLQLMLRTHKPKVIVYDFYPNYDISENDNVKYINNLKPYANESCLKDLFDEVNPMEKLKTISSFYVFNTNFIQLYKDSRKPFVRTFDGYFPLKNIMNYEPKEEKSTYTIDILKQKYFSKFISTCKRNDIQLIITFSPFYKSIEWENENYLYEICKSNNLVLLDYYAEGFMSGQKNMYKDPMHLNDFGARRFSQRFAVDLKQILKEYK